MEESQKKSTIKSGQNKYGIMPFEVYTEAALFSYLVSPWTFDGCSNILLNLHWGQELFLIGYSGTWNGKWI